MPDFIGWCEQVRARLPGLAPADIVFVTDQAELTANIVDADAVIVESLIIDRAVLAAALNLALIMKVDTESQIILNCACPLPPHLAHARAHGFRHFAVASIMQSPSKPLRY